MTSSGPEGWAEVDVEDSQALGTGGLHESADGVARGWAALGECAEADRVGPPGELVEFVGPGDVVPGGVLGNFERWLASIVERDVYLAGGVVGELHIGCVDPVAGEEFNRLAAKGIGADSAYYIYVCRFARNEQLNSAVVQEKFVWSNRRTWGRRGRRPRGFRLRPQLFDASA